MAWHPFGAFGRASRLIDLAPDDVGAMVSGFNVDVREDDDRYTIEADLPGVNKDWLDVTFEDGVLTIAAERRKDERHEEGDFHIRERRVGRTSRSLRLPSEADPDKVHAQLADGVLTVTVEKVEAQKPRKIAVQGG